MSPQHSPFARVLLAVLLPALVAAEAAADGLVQRLPKDGSWVEYHTVLTAGGSETTGTVTLKSVGEANAGGKAARWIEIVMKATDESAQTTIYKMLIAEDDLKTGVDPVDHVIRAWQKQGEGEPRTVDAEALDRVFAGAFLHGPLMDVETLPETRKLDYQDGTLEAKGVTGKRKIDLKNLQGTLVSRTWPSERVPFGTAALSIELLGTDGSKTLGLDLVVNDFGTGAESALPDAK